jgi:multidrug resistance efflux pump
MATERIDARVTPAGQPAVAAAAPEGGPAGLEGITRPRDVIALSVPAQGVVDRVFVAIGDRVEPGQALLVITDGNASSDVIPSLDLAVARARTAITELEGTIALLDRTIDSITASNQRAAAQLALAERQTANLPASQAQAFLRRAQLAYDDALARERRAADMALNGVLAMQELEEAQRGVRVAADGFAAARRALEGATALASVQAVQVEMQADLFIAARQRERQERRGEFARAQLKLREAEAALEQATGRASDSTVRAPQGGLVAELAVRPGDRLQAGTPLVKIATVNPMVVDVEVPGSAVPALKRGDPVSVHLLRPEQHFAGRIAAIAPLPGRAGTHSMQVEFDNVSGALLAGRPARVSLREHP